MPYALFKDGVKVISGELYTMSLAWRFAFQFNAVSYTQSLATLKEGYEIKEVKYEK